LTDLCLTMERKYEGKRKKDKRKKIKDKSGHKVAAPKAGKHKVLKTKFHNEGNPGGEGEIKTQIVN